jgi:hypothetical protein
MITAGARILAPNGKLAVLEAYQNNWYEGSRWSPNRSWVWFPVQDAKRDLDRFTRYELSKHARYLYKNSPFMRGLIRRLVTLTVGNGFVPVFKSEKKPKWAAAAQKWWSKRSRNINLGHRASFSQYQRAIGMVRFLDGEGFSIKTFDELNYDDRVQGVEADKCTGGPTDSYAEGSDAQYVDGIGLNRQGTPVSYKFKGVDRPYAAADVIHHYTPARPGQYRGETILAAAINTARDVDDILSLEKMCVKDASSRKDVIQRKTGEINPETIRSLRYGNSNTGGFPTIFNLPADQKTKTDYYQVKLGAESLVLEPGDEYTPYKPDRPGSAWQGFMDFLSNTICLSAEMPPSVILPINVGGTDIRRDLDIAQRVVEPWQGDMVLELEDVIMYMIGGEIADGSLGDAPDDWWIQWHFPTKINVDRQTAREDREDVKQGLMSVEEYHGRYGGDGDTYEQTVIAEAKRRKERIIAAGFKDVKEFVQVLSMNPQMFAQQATPEGNQKDENIA